MHVHHVHCFTRCWNFCFKAYCLSGNDPNCMLSRVTKSTEDPLISIREFLSTIPGLLQCQTTKFSSHVFVLGLNNLSVHVHSDSFLFPKSRLFSERLFMSSTLYYTKVGDFWPNPPYFLVHLWSCCIRSSSCREEVVYKSDQAIGRGNWATGLIWSAVVTHILTQLYIMLSPHAISNESWSDPK